MSTIKLYFLGSPRIEYNHRLVNFDRRKAIALLAYLALNEEPQERDAIATLLWPELAQDRARSALRRVVLEIRTALGQEWIEGDRQTITLARTPGLWTDVHEFQQVIGSARQSDRRADLEAEEVSTLAAAVKLYRADFLAGFTLNSSVNFDEWQLFQTEQLRRQCAIALEQLVGYYASRDEYTEALAYAQRWLALDALHEAAQQALMELYARSGQQAAALRQYQIYVKLLDAELGEAPSLETQALYERIRAGHFTVLTPDVQRSLLRHNLPVQPTSFIGREAELAKIAELLADPHCRLLTLVGPGGIGKTRLALQAAEEQRDHFEHGVHFLALATLNSIQQVAMSALDMFHVTQQSHLTSEEQLLHYLRNKRLLLILDNFEHLREGAGLVKQILNAAPHVKLVITSRERLKVQEEWLLPVTGMDLPPMPLVPVAEKHLDALEGFSAIRLFVERARRVQPDFSLTAANAAAVIQICQLVDALPLGIELAAAWTRIMSCVDIAQEIVRSLDFLTASWQDVPPRHQSLTAVIEHSWRLLSPQEQEILCQLTVFRGGFRSAAATAVADASLPLLADLVDKSWLRVTGSGRFDMHEVVRQFASKKLTDALSGVRSAHAGSSEEVRARHSVHYATFLHEREPFLHGHRQLEILNELLAEVENIRLGWRWAIDNLEVELINQYLKSWQWLGEVRAWNRDMVQMFGEAAGQLKAHLACLPEQATSDVRAQLKLVLARTLHCQARHMFQLASPTQVQSLCEESLSYWPDAERDARYMAEQTHIKLLLGEALYDLGRYAESERICREAWHECQTNRDQVGLQDALYKFGINAYTQGDVAEAQEWFTQSVAVANDMGEQVRKIYALGMLGEILCNRGDTVAAQQIAWEVNAISETFGYTFGIAGSYILLGYAAFVSGHLAQARNYFQNGLTLVDEIGDEFMRLNCRRWLGNTAYLQHEYAAAGLFFAEALASARTTHRLTFVAIALTGLGNVAYALGKYDAAGQHFHQALDILRAIHAVPDLLHTFASLSQLWMQMGYVEPAACLLAFTLHHPAVLPYTRSSVVQTLAELQTKIPDARFTAACTAGIAMRLEDATAFTREER